MPSIEPPTEVTVRVKIPPGHIHATSLDEFSLGALSVSLPVSALRQRIQTLVPSHPLPTHQRILYGGRALVEDGQSLADALNIKRDPSQTDYVVHLLIRDGGDHGRSGPNTPQPHHHEQRSTQPHPHPVHGHAVNNVPGMMQLPHMPAPFHMHGQIGLPGLPGMIPPPPRPRSQTSDQIHNLPRNQHEAQPNGQQNIQATSGDLNAQQSQASQHTSQTQRTHTPHHHHHHHHHHPHVHPHAHPHTPDSQHHAHGHAPPPRPVSGQDFHLQGIGPNGERFAIHQHTINLPLGLTPEQAMAAQHGDMSAFSQLGAQLGQGAVSGRPFQGAQGQLPMLPLPFQLPGFPQPLQNPGQPPAVSALDRVRENMAEMRRMLDDMRAESGTDESRARVASLERNMQAVNEFIDPLRLGSGPRPRTQPQTNPVANTEARDQPRAASATPILQHQTQQPINNPFMNFRLPMGPLQSLQLPQMRPAPAPSPTGHVSAYLLSSPEGPQALVFTPDHGTYRGSAPQPLHQHTQALTTTTEPPSSALTIPPPDIAANAGQPHNAAQEAAPPPQVVPAGEQLLPEPDPFAFLQPIMGHVWFLLRIMIFAYFLLGNDLGWRRPLAIALIGLGFWMIRLGLFGNGGVLQRWWDGVIRMDDVRARLVRGRLRRMGFDFDAAVAQAQAQAAGNAAVGEAPQGPVQGEGAQQAPRPFPTPEELAQRLVRQQHQHDPIRRLREQIRPVERALALFAASLWPGVGERYVRALDEAREEEEAARREIERQREQAAQQAQAALDNKSCDQKEESGNGPQAKTDDGVDAATAAVQDGPATGATGSSSAAPNGSA